MVLHVDVLVVLPPIPDSAAHLCTVYPEARAPAHASVSIWFRQALVLATALQQRRLHLRQVRTMNYGGVAAAEGDASPALSALREALVTTPSEDSIHIVLTTEGAEPYVPTVPLSTDGQPTAQ